MEHGAVVDRAGEVRRIAAARGEHHVHRREPAVGVEADIVVGAEIVPLAGEAHVVVAVEAEFARPPGDARGERRDRRPLRRLALLAAERAAHAAHLDGDGGVGKPEHLRDDVLQLARVLGRGVDQHVVLAGNGERHLAFEIEVLLPADMEGAGEPARARRERRRAVALGERVVGQDVAIGFERVVDADQRPLRRDLDLAEARGAARDVAGLGDHREHHLAVEFDRIGGEHGIVAHHGTDVVAPGNIGRGEHRDDAGDLAHGVEIDAQDAPAGRRRPAGREMQRALGLAQVVDVDGACRRRGAPRNRARSAGRRRAATDRGSADHEAAAWASSRHPTTRVVWEVAPPISISALRSSACATRKRYAALARWSVIGAKSVASAAQAAAAAAGSARLGAGERRLGRPGALRRRRHAAEGDARLGDAGAVDGGA